MSKIYNFGMKTMSKKDNYFRYFNCIRVGSANQCICFTRNGILHWKFNTLIVCYKFFSKFEALLYPTYSYCHAIHKNRLCALGLK